MSYTHNIIKLEEKLYACYIEINFVTPDKFFHRKREAV